jgi:DNA repair protein RadD
MQERDASRFARVGEALHHRRAPIPYYQLEMSYDDERGRTYTLDEVIELKEEEWFSRGIALARLCNQHIIDSSLEKLEELRLSATRHQLIAVACSINHAKEIRSLYQERG